MGNTNQKEEMERKIRQLQRQKAALNKQRKAQKMEATSLQKEQEAKEEEIEQKMRDLQKKKVALEKQRKAQKEEATSLQKERQAILQLRKELDKDRKQLERERQECEEERVANMLYQGNIRSEREMIVLMADNGNEGLAVMQTRVNNLRLGPDLHFLNDVEDDTESDEYPGGY